jgi:hypothetical protein
LDSKVAIIDTYPILIKSDVEMTADDLMSALREELLPNKKLEILEQTLIVDKSPVTGSTIVKEDSKISYNCTQKGPGTVDDSREKTQS